MSSLDSGGAAGSARPRFGAHQQSNGGEWMPPPHLVQQAATANSVDEVILADMSETFTRSQPRNGSSTIVAGGVVSPVVHPRPLAVSTSSAAGSVVVSPAGSSNGDGDGSNVNPLASSGSRGGVRTALGGPSRGSLGPPAGDTSRKMKKLVWHAKRNDGMPFVPGWLNRNLFQPIFRPDESFSEHARKVAILGFCGMSATSIPALTLYPILIHYDGSNAARWTYIIVAIVILAFFDCFCYMYMRRTREGPQWLGTAAATVGVLVISSLSLTTGADVRPLLLSSFMLTCLTTSPYLVLLTALHGLGYLVDYANDYFPTEISFLQFVRDHDDSRRHVAEKVFEIVVAAIWPIAAAMGGLVYIARQYVTQIEQADRTVQLTLTVASQLQQFDTNSLANTITEFRGHLQDELLVAFEAIEANLRQFRPHVPNYVIECAAGGGADDDEEPDAFPPPSRNSARFVLATGGSSSGGGGAVRSVDRRGSSSTLELVSVESGSFTGAAASRSLLPGPSSLRRAGSVAVASGGGAGTRGGGSNANTLPSSHTTVFGGPAVTLASSFVAGSHEEEDEGSLSELSTKSASSATDGPDDVTVVRTSGVGWNQSAPAPVSSVCTTVCLQLSSLVASASATQIPWIQSLLTRVVDIVVECCDLTRGAVHHIHSDAVFLSWNASLRAASHEAKACMFFAAFRAKLSTLRAEELAKRPGWDHLFRWHATAWTGPSCALLSGTKQALLTVGGHHASAHAALMKLLADVVGAANATEPVILTNRRLRDGACHNFSFCAIASMQDPSVPSAITGASPGGIASSPGGGSTASASASALVQMPSFTTTGTHEKKPSQAFGAAFVVTSAASNSVSTATTPTNTVGGQRGGCGGGGGGSGGARSGKLTTVFELVFLPGDEFEENGAPRAVLTGPGVEWNLALRPDYFAVMELVVALAGEGRLMEARAALDQLEPSLRDEQPAVARVLSNLQRGRNLVFVGN